MSGGARHATGGGRESGHTLEVDVAAAVGADHRSSLLQLATRGTKRTEIRARLSQQRAGLRPFVGDGGALGVVLVIRRRQLGSLDDGGNDRFQVGDLSNGSRFVGVDERKHAPQIELGWSG